MVSTIEVHWRELRFRQEEILDKSLFYLKAVPFNMYAEIGAGGDVRIVEQKQFEITGQCAEATEARQEIIEQARQEIQRRGTMGHSRFALTPKEFPVAKGYRSRAVGFATVSAAEPLAKRRMAA